MMYETLKRRVTFKSFFFLSFYFLSVIGIPRAFAIYLFSNNTTIKISLFLIHLFLLPMSDVFLLDASKLDLYQDQILIDLLVFICFHELVI